MTSSQIVEGRTLHCGGVEHHALLYWYRGDSFLPAALVTFDCTSFEASRQLMFSHQIPSRVTKRFRKILFEAQVLVLEPWALVLQPEF
jgi:hypothetical protein